jgi:hypothetical protein
MVGYLGFVRFGKERKSFGMSFCEKQHSMLHWWYGTALVE